MADGPLVRVTRRMNAAPERVFDAFLDPQIAGRFLFRTDGGELVRCEMDGRVGGRFTIVEKRGEEHAEHLGEFLELERPGRLVFLFGVHGWDGEFDRIVVEIAGAGGGSEVTLVHQMQAHWADWESKTREGWGMILDRLGRTLG